VVKRHHFHGGPKTHGQSDRNRAPGAIGSTTYPGRVWKNVRMAGHMGDERSTAANLPVFKADAAKNLLLIEGSVPGAINSLVIIRKSNKGS
jgi:large subunit ribosomal protein L3